VGNQALHRIREICATFPEVAEQVRDANAFSVRGRNFVVFWPNWFSNPRPSVWCKAPLGVQEQLIARDGERFFVPAWMGRFGWIGVWLDPPPDDWDELAEIFETAYRMTAPRRLTAKLDNPS